MVFGPAPALGSVPALQIWAEFVVRMFVLEFVVRNLFLADTSTRALSVSANQELASSSSRDNIIWGQGLGLVTPFLLSPGTRGRAAAAMPIISRIMRGLGLLT